MFHLDTKVDGEDQGIDPQQQQGVEESPEKSQDRSPVAGLQFPEDQAVDQAAVAENFPEVDTEGLQHGINRLPG